MSFQPFSADLVDCRAVRIPAALDAENRARFIARLTAAVKQQAAIAEQSDAGLRVTGEVIVTDDLALIPHEPVAPLLPNRILERTPDDLPDVATLMWLTERVFRALASAAAQSTIHGGLQLASLYRDHLGLVKVGDFGVATAFESTIGAENRRQLHCESASIEVNGRRAWGCWSILPEGESRSEGWIAPYFGHELLDGRNRLNPRGDQFAAAVVLFLIACGKHPFGAELSDPSLLFYFHLEPYSPTEGRDDWREIFERAAGDVSQNADKPILAWTNFIHKACASDPGQRFPNPVEALKTLATFAPGDWDTAANDLRDATAALNTGDAEEFLRLATPWTKNGVIPEIWSAPLGEWVARVEAEKEVIARRKRCEQKLAEAQRAFHLSDLAKARRLLDEARADEFEDLRPVAVALQAQITELEEFIRSGADEVAQAYLDTAREQISQSDLAAARQVLSGVLGDAALPPSRKAQAHDLLAQIELQEQTAQRQLDELTGALDDLRRGRYTAAERRLQDLADENNAPEPVAQQAQMLLAETQRARAEHERLAQIVERARSAWEHGEEVALTEALAELPEKLSDEPILAAREDLLERAAGLKAALASQEAAQKHFESGDLEGALGVLNAANTPMAPQVVRDAIEVHAGLIREAQAEIVRERRREADAALAEAAHALDQLDVRTAEHALEDPALDDPAVQTAAREERARLRTVIARIGKVNDVIDHARTDLTDGEFVSGMRLIDGIDLEGLPTALRDRIKELRGALETAQEAVVEADRERFDQALAELTQATQRGEITAAHAARLRLEEAQRLDPPRVESRQKALSRLRDAEALAATLEAAERAIQSGDETTAADTLSRLPTDVPEWAASRTGVVRRRIDEIVEERRLARLKQAETDLDAAERAIADCDLEVVIAKLNSAAAPASEAPALNKRFEALRLATDELRYSLKRVERLESEAQHGAVLSVSDAIRDALADAAMPATLRPRLQAAAKICNERLAARRAEIDKELEGLAQQISKRGRRARGAPAKLVALNADELATDSQQKRIAELQQQYEAAPIPKTNWTPIVAGSIAAVVIGGIGFLLLRPTPAPTSPITPPQADPQLVENPTRRTNAPSASDPAPQSPTSQAIALNQPRDPIPKSPSPPTTAPEKPSEPQRIAKQESIEEPPVPAPEPKPAAPTFDVAAEAFELELIQRLGANVTVDLDLDQVGGVETRVRWRSLNLPTLAGPAFDAETGTFEKSPAQIAELFAPQVTALDTAVRGALRVEIDGVHDGFIEWISPKSSVSIAVDNGAIQISCPAKLRGDTRPEAQFQLTGVVDKDLLRAGEASRKEFAAKLGTLRVERLRVLLSQTLSGLAAPKSFHLSADGDEGDPGATRSIFLRNETGRPLAEGEASWSPNSLEYTLDRGGFLRAARQGFGAWVSAEAVSFTPQLKSVIAISDEHVGAEYWKSMIPGETILLPMADDAPWTASVEFTFGDQGVARIKVDGRVGVADDGKLDLLDAGSAEQINAVTQGLSRLNGDAEFRKARQADTLKSETASIADAEISAHGDELTITSKDGRKRVAKWDSNKLAYGALTEVAPPAPKPEPAPPKPEEKPVAVAPSTPTNTPPTNPTPTPQPATPIAGNVEDSLRRLAASPDATLFAATLAQVTRAKADARGWSGYGPMASIESGGDGRARLIAVSTAMQNMVAANPQIDPYPTVFLEHFVGAGSVWALSWRVKTDAYDNIRDVTDLQAWEVMPTSRLQAISDTTQLLHAVANDAALGEALLGKALGPTLDGSAKSGDGAFGVMIAPDERLWLTRWDQVRITPRRTQNIGLRDTDDPGEVASLRAVLRPKQRTNDLRFRRVGVWQTPSLAGSAKRDVNGMQLTLGVAAGKPLTAKFKSLGNAGYAALVAPDIPGGFGRVEFERGARLNDIGYKFWDEKWVGDAWQPNSFVSFCLAPTGP